MTRSINSLQHAFSDCGYACISILLGHFKVPAPTHAIKSFVGSTERGLSITQLRDALQKVGASATAIAFDRERPTAYPCPGIVLLKRGHFVAITHRRGEKFKVFDPAAGWQMLHYKRFELEPISLGIEVTNVTSQAISMAKTHHPFLPLALRHARTRLGGGVLLLGLLAQSILMMIPLFVKNAVDAVVPGAGMSSLSMMTMAFVLMVLIGNLSSVISSVGSRIVNKRVGLALAGDIFDRLARKDVDWLQSRPQGYVLTQYQALLSLQQFYGEVMGRLISAVLMGVVGITAIFFISPWLIIPGLISMVASSGLDFAFRTRQQGNNARMIQMQTQQRTFFLDVMSQLPLLTRLGSLWRGRARMRRRLRAVADAQLATTRLNAAESAILKLFTTIEQVVFVCLAGYFVKTENYSLGVFVAAGLYKDQFANALSTLFQLWQQYALLLPQREQLAELMAEEPLFKTASQQVVRGDVRASAVSFRYGTLDEWVLKELDLVVNSGECIVLKGPSGAGKTTLIKLICGAVSPGVGEVLIDGKPVSAGMRHMGVVLQSDRLITDSIRGNILMFRGNISDDDVYAALAIVGLEEFVRTLPMQLNTGIGEAMTGLSGGQRQRILLARALVGTPRLLIFDEATSSLDVDGERQIFLNLKSLGITLIIWSHRTEVWAHADAVYEVAKGVAKRMGNVAAIT
jgi:ATP-binding cassette, subfamily B, bacterial CvaB/MchF/RaxB